MSSITGFPEVWKEISVRSGDSWWLANYPLLATKKQAIQLYDDLERQKHIQKAHRLSLAFLIWSHYPPPKKSIIKAPFWIKEIKPDAQKSLLSEHKVAQLIHTSSLDIIKEKAKIWDVYDLSLIIHSNYTNGGPIKLEILWLICDNYIRLCQTHEIKEVAKRVASIPSSSSSGYKTEETRTSDSWFNESLQVLGLETGRISKIPGLPYSLVEELNEVSALTLLPEYVILHESPVDKSERYTKISNLLIDILGKGDGFTNQIVEWIHYCFSR